MSWAGATSSKEGIQKIGIPPNLIKNFNAYELLEPVQANKQINNETLLIDLDSPPQSDFGQSSRPQDKNGFDLIDVYENIYVTPHLVTNKPKETKVHNKDTDIDYADFIRKLEAGKKIDWTESYPAGASVTEYQQHQLDFDKTFDKLANLNESEAASANINGRHVEIFDTKDHDDLIDELLFEKSLAKMKINDALSTENVKNIKVLTAPKIQNNTHNQGQNVNYQKQNMTRTQNIQKEKQLCWDEYAKSTFRPHENDRTQSLFDHKKIPQVPFDTKHKEPVLKASELNAEMVKNFLQAVECKAFNLNTPQSRSSSSSTDHSLNCQVTSPSTSGVDSGIFLRYSPKLNNLKDLPSLTTLVKSTNNDAIKTDNTLFLINVVTNPEVMSSMPVQAVVKDNKSFSKSRIVTSEMEKLKYTKGPDLNEKKIVLPQLLHRLGLHRKVDEESNTKKRLILDAGSKNNNTVEIPVKLNPTVLMEDCNKKRLQALKTRQSLEKFVRDGNILY